MQEKIVKLKKIKLLFVEDEDDLLKIISQTLKKLDADFITARNGKEALESLKNNPIDVVITDINMPFMNGLDLVKKINEFYPNIKIIIMSTETQTDYINKAINLGAADYLIKPFDFIKFIDLITAMDK